MFPMTRPIAVLLILAAATGAAEYFHRPAARADLTVWVFADDEAATFRSPPPAPPSPPGGQSLIERFHRLTGRSVTVQLLAQRALDSRLMSLFMSDDPRQTVPDLVELDLSSVPMFFRPPATDIGLLPLNTFLEESGDLQRIFPSRLVPWSRHGLIFGIPRDVHPVTITYRKDLFDQAGVDLESAATWPAFQRKCLQFQRYWSEHGAPRRRAMELYATQSEELLLMLLQRHINLVDDGNGLHLTDPAVAQTLAFYAQLAAGPDCIAAATTIPGTPFGYRDLADGSVCAMFTPDWRAAYIKQFAPELAGKLRMMPLPVFDPSDAPTSTWGGTMIGIPRRCKNPRAAWQLLEYLCLSRQGLQARRTYSDIIPPLKELWSDPVYQSSDPFFGGQAIDQLYISLAGRIPPRCMTPFSITAQSALTMVLNKAVAYAAEHGQDGLPDACAGWLAEAQKELAQWVRYGDFDP
jgi:arabinooligosaccharide transport system substrate-binding protein